MVLVGVVDVFAVELKKNEDDSGTTDVFKVDDDNEINELVLNEELVLFADDVDRTTELVSDRDRSAVKKELLEEEKLSVVISDAEEAMSADDRAVTEFAVEMVAAGSEVVVALLTVTVATTVCCPRTSAAHARRVQKRCILMIFVVFG